MNTENIIPANNPTTIKMQEYIDFLINDDDFVIESNDINRTFSNGKKIGPFFAENHNEIIKQLFLDSNYKGKVYCFKARAKIIDYFISHNVNRMQDSANIILSYLENFENIEDTIRCVSISMSNDSNRKFENGINEYMKYNNYSEDDEYDIEDYMNNSGMSFAMAAEKNFKSFIIFNEGLKSENYTFYPSNMQKLTEWRIKKKTEKKLIIGSSEWRKELNKKGDYGAIRSEMSILELIRENSQLPTLDKRETLLDRDIKKSSGHDLYSLYKLLDPISKMIVNSEFYIYDSENPDNKNKPVGMLAVLKEKIEYEQAGTTDILNNLKEYSEDFVKARYADIDLNNIKSDELEFLKRLSTSLQAYCSYKFPLRKKYDNIDFNKVNMNLLNEEIIDAEDNKYKKPKYPFFYKLDKVTKYYLLQDFKKQEIEVFNNYCIEKLKNELDYIQLGQFVNIAIFFKHYVKEQLKMELPFENIVFENLTRYFNSIKDFDLFNGASNNLFLNNFFTKENIERLQREINMLNSNKKTKKNVEIEEVMTFLSGDYKTKDEYQLKKFLSNNKEIINNLLLKDERYKDSKYDVIRKIVEDYQFSRDKNAQIEEFIEMLNNGNVAILNQRNKETFDRHPNISVGQFFAHYKHEIVRLLLEDERYKDSKYDAIRKIVEDYQFSRDKNAQIEEFLEMNDYGKDYPEMFTPINIKHTKTKEIIQHLKSQREKLASNNKKTIYSNKDKIINNNLINEDNIINNYKNENYIINDYKIDNKHKKR